jgi:hypothetical protein
MNGRWILGGMVAIVGAAACKTTPAPVAEAPPASAAPTALPAPSAAPAARVEATTRASASPSGSPAPEAAPTRLHLYADVRADYELIPGAGGALLFSSEGGDVVRIEGDTVTRAYGFWAGLSSYGDRPGSAGRVEGFGGRYPDHVYAQVGAFAPRGTTDHQIHQWKGGGSWSPLVTSGNGDFASITAVAPYHGGFAAAVTRMGSEFELSASVGSGFSPRASQKGKGCHTRLREVHDLVAPAGGGLLAIGMDCEGGADAVEVFSDEGTSIGFHLLPDLTDVRIVAPTTGEIYLAGAPSLPKATPSKAAPSATALASAAPSAPAPSAPAAPPGKPFFALLRGETWSPEPLPGEEPITSLDDAPDGSLWAVSAGAVWRRPRSGAWAKVALPEGAAPTSVIVGSASDVWAVEQSKGAMKVYRSRPPRRPIVAGPAPDKPAALTPATAACETPFVLLYGITGNVAPDYDFPLTRTAMKGYAELAGTSVVVTEDWQLGAFVPSVDVGEKLAAVIREKVKGQKPQVLCAQPRIRYELPFDLATGELTR